MFLTIYPGSAPGLPVTAVTQVITQEIGQWGKVSKTAGWLGAGSLQEVLLR